MNPDSVAYAVPQQDHMETAVFAGACLKNLAPPKLPAASSRSYAAIRQPHVAPVRHLAEAFAAAYWLPPLSRAGRGSRVRRTARSRS
jgi:hypothetical protein